MGFPKRGNNEMKLGSKNEAERISDYHLTTLVSAEHVLRWIMRWFRHGRIFVDHERTIGIRAFDNHRIISPRLLERRRSHDHPLFLSLSSSTPPFSRLLLRKINLNQKVPSSFSRLIGIERCHILMRWVVAPPLKLVHHLNFNYINKNNIKNMIIYKFLYS